MHFMCGSQLLQVRELELGCKNLTDMMVHLLSAIVCLSQYRDLTIEILHEGQHVAKSPYTLQGLLVLFVACRILCRIAHKCYLAITVKLIFIQD